MEVEVKNGKAIVHIELEQLADFVIEIMKRRDKEECDSEEIDMAEIELPIDIVSWIEDDPLAMAKMRYIMQAMKEKSKE